ncbi:MAG: PEP-CTERM sorting domain-containing protein [Candidatus Hydrogenedentes bacterium]|nr:PEP-CTERM sorting domain-containing protein [Candidatus Hydrogenedentota bacterium]
MFIRLGIVACTVACVLLPMTAQAEIIYDNGGPDSTTGGSDSTVFVSLNPDFASFDDFVLDAGSNTITDIHWWGNYYTFFGESLDDFFVIYIFDDDNGHPDLSSGPLHTIDGTGATRVDTGLDVGGDEEMPIFEYDLFIDPITLDPDVVYWMAITNDFHWRWQTSLVPGGAYQVGGINLEDSFTDSEDDLTARDYGLAFNLTATVVPEPSTIVLLGAGIAAIAAARRMQRR